MGEFRPIPGSESGSGSVCCLHLFSRISLLDGQSTSHDAYVSGLGGEAKNSLRLCSSEDLDPSCVSVKRRDIQTGRPTNTPSFRDG